jgi:hypothetical protein
VTPAPFDRASAAPRPDGRAAPMKPVTAPQSGEQVLAVPETEQSFDPAASNADSVPFPETV